jgi:quercetin dioxygenase-like cupin family protein
MMKLVQLFLLVIVIACPAAALGQGTTASDLPSKIIAFSPDEPEPLIFDAGAIVPNKVRYLTTAGATGGKWSLVELTENPGTKTTWHRHNRTDQAYYVIEGVVTFKIKEKTYEYGPGGYVFIPRGTPHGHANRSSSVARVLLTNSPAGFDQYFNARAELLKTMKPGDLQFKKKMAEYRNKYDAEEIGTW